jgi:hypothetical protein
MKKETESTGMVGSLQASLNVTNCWIQETKLLRLQMTDISDMK